MFFIFLSIKIIRLHKKTTLLVAQHLWAHSISAVLRIFRDRVKNEIEREEIAVRVQIHYTLLNTKEGGTSMCRNIKPLFNFSPPVTDEEIRAAALQFVRKVSGFNHPSHANEQAFVSAVGEIAAASQKLLNSLETDAPPKNRAKEAAKARARSARRFAA